MNFSVETSTEKKKRGRPRTQIGPCSVEGCNNPSRCTGLCSMHYMRKLKKGSPGSPFNDRIGIKVIERCAAVMSRYTDNPATLEALSSVTDNIKRDVLSRAQLNRE